MKNTELDERRNRWLETARRVMEACVLRVHVLDRRIKGGCGFDLDEAEEMPARISAQTEEVNRLCSELRAIEAESGSPIGSAALLGQTATDVEILTAVAVLVVAAISPAYWREAGDVGDLSELAGGTDIGAVTHVQQALVGTGVLAKSVCIETDRYSRLRRRVMLREAALSRALCLPLDPTLDRRWLGWWW